MPSILLWSAGFWGSSETVFQEVPKAPNYHNSRKEQGYEKG